MAKSQNKTVETKHSVDEFLNTITDEQRKKDSFEILELMKSVTSENPKMWGTSIVGFGKYHYKYESGREGDFVKVGFSPRKTSLTPYIIPGFDRYEELMTKLGKYKTGKSCLYVQRLADVDLSILKQLILESYEYMSNKYG